MFTSLKLVVLAVVYRRAAGVLHSAEDQRGAGPLTQHHLRTRGLHRSPLCQVYRRASSDQYQYIRGIGKLWKYPKHTSK
jgi:hypothetical protein